MLLVVDLVGSATVPPEFADGKPVKDGASEKTSFGAAPLLPVVSVALLSKPIFVVLTVEDAATFPVPLDIKTLSKAKLSVIIHFYCVTMKG
jgi:hypothetical protein